MFGLKVPISATERKDEFDSVSTILSQSSITRKSLTKGSPEWLTSGGDEGEIFHLELPTGVETRLARLSSLDGGSVSSLALGAGCNSEDTGYSSDQELSLFEQASKIAKKRSKSSKLSSKARTSSSSSGSDKLSVGTTKSRSVGGSVLDESLDDGVFLQKSNFRSSQTSTVSSSSTSSHCSCGEQSHVISRHIHRTRPSCTHTLSKHCDNHHDWRTTELEVLVHSSNAWTSSSPNGSALCEQLLGIVLLAKDDNSYSRFNGSHVIIKGLLPHSDPVMKPEILVGRRLHSIDGQELTWCNMDTLMSSISKFKKVKLTLKSLRPEKSELDLEKLVSILTSEPHDHHGMEGMAAMYLSLEGSSQDDSGNSHDGLVYSYPAEKNSLHQLQGMFYTLAHLVKDIKSDSTIRNTTLTIDDQRIHVAYQQEYSDILVFAMPASHVSVSQLNTLLSEFARLLRILYGSIESAFNKSHHSGWIDNILTYLFRQVMQTSQIFSTNSSPGGLKEKVNLASECLPFVRYSHHISSISLPEDLKVEVDKSLSKFSSSDFADMSEHFYGCRRKYHILGSCFYYSGQLVSNQLAPSDLQDIHLYLQHHGLLELTACCSVAQLVVWHEVYPTRFCHDIADINNTFGYSEPNARWCHLIVGLKYGIFCCLLETVSVPMKKLSPLSADVFYIDQAKACLLQLQTPNLLTALNISVSRECQSAVTKSDYCATYIKTSYEKTTQMFGESLKQKSHSNSSFVAALQSDWRKLSPRTVATGENFYQSPESGKLYPVSHCSVAGSGSLELSIPTSLSANPCISRISSGRNPSIYQYCYLDGLEGTLVIGADVDSSGIFQSQIVHTFYLCCRQIHDFFHDMGEKWQSSKHQVKGGDNEHYDEVNADCSLSSMKEHGVLMTFNPHIKEDGHKSNQALEYWVVGRKLKRPSSREMFVCFHALTSQLIIDLAFKLS
ncbi:protein inturned [Biomphalaria glabrata]|nr:protein inturned [Biomphalaria glabrata]